MTNLTNHADDPNWLCTQKYWLENEEVLIPVKGLKQSGGDVTGIQSVSCSSCAHLSP